MNDANGLINETQEFAVPTGFPPASSRNETIFDSTQSFDITSSENFHVGQINESSNGAGEFPETQNFDGYAVENDENFLSGPTQGFEMVAENVDHYPENNQNTTTLSRGNVSDDSYLSTQPFGDGVEIQSEFAVLESNTQQFDPKPLNTSDDFGEEFIGEKRIFCRFERFRTDFLFQNPLKMDRRRPILSTEELKLW